MKWIDLEELTCQCANSAVGSDMGKKVGAPTSPSRSRHAKQLSGVVCKQTREKATAQPPTAMFARSSGRALVRAIDASSQTSIPSFLIPALHRPFSASTANQSKLGRTPISIPPGVELTVSEPWLKKDATNYKKIYKKTVTVEGPLGKQSLEVPAFVNFDHDADSRKTMLSIENKEEKNQREMWGTTWAYVQRYIIGVSEGHTAVLRMVGIGYRATVEDRPEKEEYPGQKFVCLKLGFSHPVELGLPLGMKASTPQPTRILLEGINREEVMSFAAECRKWRVPEPYKGKGIFVNDETIKLKQKKVK
ncbi:54S ribosomal protein L6 [Pyricularia oryzae]|nr:54S ribosomal protein L6 [Pyricularia oryzae]KAI7922772.1 54S ribosomal protein L6 [Pyricularia oryzae]